MPPTREDLIRLQEEVARIRETERAERKEVEDARG